MKVLKKKKVQLPAKKRNISTTELSPGSSKNRTSTLPVEEDPAMGIIGLGSSGKRNISAHHDKYLVKYAKASRTVP